MPKSRSDKASGQAQKRNEEARKKQRGSGLRGADNGGTSQKGGATPK